MRFADFIYKSLERAHESDDRKGVGISQIGYCELRTQKYYINGEKPNIPVDRLLAMRTGTATHAELFRLLWKFRGDIEGFTYKVKEQEVSIQTPAGNTLTGHFDLWAKVGDEDEIADLKVVDSGPFGWIHSEQSRMHEYCQINCYAAAAGIKKCRLVYLCKGGKKTTADVKEYPFAVDTECVNRMLAKYDRIMAGKAEKPFEDPGDSWECGICPFYTECWGAKTFTMKKEGVVEIPQDLEDEYVREKTIAEEHEARAKEVKEQIEALLDGKRGEGQIISAYYSAPRSYTKYDSSLLKKYVEPEKLEKCGKPVNKDGYYRINIRKS